MSTTTEEAPTPEEIIVTANCPICGQPFEIPLDILSWFTKNGCAVCQSQTQEAEHLIRGEMNK